MVGKSVLGLDEEKGCFFTSASSGLWQSLWDEDMDPPFSCEGWKKGAHLSQDMEGGWERPPFIGWRKQLEGFAKADTLLD